MRCHEAHFFCSKSLRNIQGPMECSSLLVKWQRSKYQFKRFLFPTPHINNLGLKLNHKKAMEVEQS